MTPAQREELEAIRLRIDLTAAQARMMGYGIEGLPDDGTATDAIAGLTETLWELAGRLDAVVSA